MLIPVLIAVTVAVVLITIILIASGAKGKVKTAKSDRLASNVQKKGVSAVAKEYEKKLVHDPHNVEALTALGAVYYDDGNWENGEVNDHRKPEKMVFEEGGMRKEEGDMTDGEEDESGKE